MRLIVLATLLLLPIPAFAQPIDAIRPQYNKFSRCQFERAAGVAKQDGDPISLGRAIVRMCPREANELIDALQAVRRPEQALKLYEYILARQVEKNAATIVEVRAKRASTPKQ